MPALTSQKAFSIDCWIYNMRRGISGCIALAVLVLLSCSSAHALLDEADAEQCDASGPRADCGELLRLACLVGKLWCLLATAFMLSTRASMQPSPRRGSRPSACRALCTCGSQCSPICSLWRCRRLCRHRQTGMPRARLLLAAREAVPAQATNCRPVVFPPEQQAEPIRRRRRRADRCAPTLRASRMPGKRCGSAERLNPQGAQHAICAACRNAVCLMGPVTNTIGSSLVCQGHENGHVSPQYAGCRNSAFFYCCGCQRYMLWSKCVENGLTQCSVSTGAGGMRWKLTLAEAAQPELGPDVEKLVVEMEPLEHDAGVHITYRDAASQRWEVPKHLLGPRADGAQASTLRSALAHDAGCAGDCLRSMSSLLPLPHQDVVELLNRLCAQHCSSFLVLMGP